MLWVYGHYNYLNSLSAGDILYTPESEVYRRQILTYKDGPRAERVMNETSVSESQINPFNHHAA